MDQESCKDIGNRLLKFGCVCSQVTFLLFRVGSQTNEKRIAGDIKYCNQNDLV